MKSFELRNNPILFRPSTILLFFFVILFIVRFLIIINSMNNVECEEAIPGVIAKHIMEHNYDQSIFDYAPAYVTGFFVTTSFIAIPFFILFGISTISLKMVAMSYILGVLVGIFLFSYKFFSYRVAVLASILYILSPTSLIQESLYAHKGLFQANLFILLIMGIYFYIAKNKVTNYKYFLCWGLICGFASWHHFSAFIPIFICLVFWFIFNKKFMFTGQFICFLVSFIVGFSPMIYYHFTHHGESLLSSSALITGFNFKNLSIICKRFFDLVFTKMPNLFYFNNFFTLGYKVQSHLYYFILVFSYFFIVWKNRSQLVKLILKLVPGNSLRLNFLELREIFILIFPLLYLFLIALTEYSEMFAPRYILPLYSSFFLIFAIAFNKLFSDTNKFIRLLSVLVIIFLFTIGLNTSIKQIYSGDTCAVNLRPLIKALQKKDIKFVYVTFYERWPLLFESKEEVVTSNCGIWDYLGNEQRKDRSIISDFINTENYPKYDSLVNNATKYAYIFRNGSEFGHNEILQEYLKEKEIRYDVENVDGFIIYSSFSKEARPSDVDFRKRWEERQGLYYAK